MRTAGKTWHLLQHDAPAIARLSASLSVSPIVAQLLINRNITESEPARRFLTAPLKELHEPGLLPGMTQAVDAIHAAIGRHDRICVYGDYDVDGVTGTTILLLGLRLLGAQVEFHVPNRLDDGYGLNCDALRQLAQNGIKLVITVDCGISSVAEAEVARQLGIELIVTDHHEFREELPNAAALVHPRLPGGQYPFGGLSGSGVAFKLAWALCQRAAGGQRVGAAHREYLLDSMALAALGTVADMVPMNDENRIFVRHGLARLKDQPSVGLKALLESAGLDQKKNLISSDIGFGLAPRINAVGRLGCARLAVELLTTPIASRAVELARFLEGQNQQRQQMERRIFSSARELAESADFASHPALVLASPEWHAGLIGIVAGRLAELYGRPVMLIAMKESPDSSQGSGRSVPGFPLHQALRACESHLISHGGHAAAAGFKIRPDDIDAFRHRFCDYAAGHFAGTTPSPRWIIDAEVSLSSLTLGLVQAVGQLEPYGSGNPQPLFLAGDLHIVGEPRKLGTGERHLSFRVRQQAGVFRTIAFGMADRVAELTEGGGQCSLVFTPKINEWQGYRSVELEVKDIYPGPKPPLG